MLLILLITAASENVKETEIEKTIRFFVITFIIGGISRCVARNSQSGEGAFLEAENNSERT